jgi:pimeloyl-ACP methyl ester carboxylesterase
MVAIALMKLLPIHRRLTELEIKNIQDYFNSDFVSPERRQKISRAMAFLMTYFGAIQRIAQVSKQARQDYYALNRRGKFATEYLPVLQEPVHPDSQHLPLLIVPGLNTPPVFFREMHGYFTRNGYNVSVMTLPNNGFADVASSAEALHQEILQLRDRCNASQVNIVGHCLGGLIAKYCLESLETAGRQAPIRHLVSLGTGFRGAEGVENLKNLWIPRNPGKPVPRVFDELIQWNLNVAKKSKDVAYHSILTIWDFMVHFRKGLLENQEDGMVVNHIIEDPAIDHLTLALNPKVFRWIDSILAAETPVLAESRA